MAPGDVRKHKAHLSTFLNGRVYCYTDNRWVSSHDDNYGGAYYQYAESGGTGVDPITEWEHMGLPLWEGCRLKDIQIIGRATSAEITDMEIRVVAQYPTDPTLWDSGASGDGVMTKETLYTGFWMDGKTGNMNHKRKKLMDIDWVAPVDCEIQIWFKPVGTFTANRYFIAGSIRFDLW